MYQSRADVGLFPSHIWRLYVHRFGLLFGVTGFFPQQNPLLDTHPALIEFRHFQEIPARPLLGFFGLFGVIHHTCAEAVIAIGAGQYVIVDTARAALPEGVVGGQLTERHWLVA